LRHWFGGLSAQEYQHRGDCARNDEKPQSEGPAFLRNSRGRGRFFFPFDLFFGFVAALVHFRRNFRGVADFQILCVPVQDRGAVHTDDPGVGLDERPRADRCGEFAEISALDGLEIDGTDPGLFKYVAQGYPLGFPDGAQVFGAGRRFADGLDGLGVGFVAHTAKIR